MRRAFHLFFNELYQLGKSKHLGVRFILHGSRGQSYTKFCHAIAHSDDVYHVLLVDSEDPVRSYGLCWQHLKGRPDDNWDRPSGVNDDQCQLMCQAIEAWLFADPVSLSEYYGDGFHVKTLSVTSNVEDIPKKTQISNLDAATKDTKKGRYHKYNHLPAILMTIDPLKVKARAPHCARIFDTLAQRITSGTWD